MVATKVVIGTKVTKEAGIRAMVVVAVEVMEVVTSTREAILVVTTRATTLEVVVIMVAMVSFLFFVCSLKCKSCGVIKVLSVNFNV